MARVKRGRVKKYDWMQTKISLQETVVNSSSPYSDSLYLDVGRCLSLLNRKLVRQGHLFRIKGMRIWSQDDSAFRFKVSTVPTNWVARNAWVKAKALWDEMNAMASANVGAQSMYPKYHDFKVYMNAAHKSQSGEVLPRDMDGNAVSTTSSHWDYSEFSDSGSTSDNYDVKYLGTHDGSVGNFTCVGLIDAYGESRVKPQLNDPVMPSDFETSPWAALFGDDDQTTDVLEDLDAHNDGPPYPPSIYVGAGDDDGGFVVGTGTCGKNTAAPQGYTVQSFNAPCGLVRIEIDDHNALESHTVHIDFDVEILGPMDM